MSNEAKIELWQVEVGAQIYEADFAELAQWIAEGALQPQDSVRKGSLRWIQAGKVGSLAPHFDAKATGTEPPPLPAVVERNIEAIDAIVDATVIVSSSDAPSKEPEQTEAVVISPPASAEPGSCRVHPHLSSVYQCRDCDGEFCKACPKSYSSVKICPVCGGMCKPVEELRESRQRAINYDSAIGSGFGLADLGNAFAYPFRFKASLIFGAVMFMFFSLGQSAASIGGIYMLASAIICFMLANMLTFGVLANTVDNFSQGKIGGNFMPDFDEFSLWDDVVHPFFLSIGVYISSFGAFLVVMIIGLYLVISSLTAQANSIQSDLEKLPGTHYYDSQRTVKQSEQIKGLLGNVNAQNEERLQTQNDLANGKAAPVVDDTEESVMRANELIQQNRKAQLESTFGKTAETREKETGEIVKGFLSLAAPLIIFGALALLWGFFYFPAACAVAGYTRSFTATLNPAVGLDTIKRLGFDYAKILGMVFLIAMCSGIVSSVFNIVFFAFDLPGFGNLPAKAAASLFGFYFSVVFSCLLGFALFKASDRLKLYR